MTDTAKKMEWTDEERIRVALNVALRLRQVSRGLDYRQSELLELILYSLSMPSEFLAQNTDKYAEFIDVKG